ICAAANISDPGATPPGRPVTSFTFSPYAIGGPLVGAAPTFHYERYLGTRLLPLIDFPAVVAISGAAVAPSMGKLSRPAFRFLLTLANIRLGVWIPNPGYIGHAEPPGRLRSLVRTTPRRLRGDRASGLEVVRTRERGGFPRVHYLWRELFGLNSLNDRYLYITDGGHYENLGLVELLRRGCVTVYCFDAGSGKNTAALGEAIAIARSELSVEIDIDPAPLIVTDGKANAMVVVGQIRYASGEVGDLFYVRSVVTDSTPAAARAYQERDPRFPHHSTLDQFYDDLKFEAYRSLGSQGAKEAIALASRHETPAASPVGPLSSS
nr:hypothetical protein [Phenylobacterium sp.]